MKLKLKLGVAIAVVLLCCLVLYVALFAHRTKGGARLIERSRFIGGTIWSKDSKALFYDIYSDRDKCWALCRYDVATGKKQFHDLPETGINRSLSPDEKWVVFTHEGGGGTRLYVAPVGSRSAKLIFEAQGDISNVCWLPQQMILFEKGNGVFVIDPNGRHKRKIVDGGNTRSNRGSSTFYYYTAKGGLRYHNLRDGKDGPLHLSGQRSEDSNTMFLYISEDKAVYWRWNEMDDQHAGLVDLRTMRNKTIHLPELGSISPDLTRYVTMERGGGEWYNYKQPEIYLGTMPTQTIREIRDP